MDIEFGMAVTDKNDKALGNIGKIFMDTWTGKPRKYMVRKEVNGPDTILFFSPAQVGEVAAGKVKLNLPAEELETT
jgi:hypothetical protein